MDVRQEVIEAEHRIRAFVRTTPVEFSHVLSAAGKCRVHLKLENQQLTGAFKLRGAMNKLLALDEPTRAKGVVAASSGNHGMAVACGASRLGCPAVVFVPDAAVESKVEAIQAYGVEVRRRGADCVLTEANARDFAAAEHMTYISPYNDPLVVAGQGTIGLELEEQLPDLDAIFVSLGGGGLVSGVGGYLKGAGRNVGVVACSPENSPVMHASLAAGRIVEMESRPTLSDGTAGGVEQGSITFDLCRRVIDECVLVTEDEIGAAIRLIVNHHHTLIEGAAGVAVAAFLKQTDRYRDKNVAILLCGANIDTDVLKRIL